MISRRAHNALWLCAFLLSAPAHAETPQSLSAKLKASLAETTGSCVAIEVGGSASGVIISPDGLVLTAAHILRKFDADKLARVTLHDGREGEMKAKRSIDPLRDKSIISKHRAPYPLVIRHALPLGAADVGTPVFDAEGEFIGVHIARYSRTMGLIIPTEQLEERVKSLLELRTLVEETLDQNPRSEPAKEEAPAQGVRAKQ